MLSSWQKHYQNFCHSRIKQSTNNPVLNSAKLFYSTMEVFCGFFLKRFQFHKSSAETQIKALVILFGYTFLSSNASRSQKHGDSRKARQTIIILPSFVLLVQPMSLCICIHSCYPNNVATDHKNMDISFLSRRTNVKVFFI